MPLSLVLGLNMPPTNFIPVIDSFSISLIMFQKTPGKTQRTSSPQPLLCQVEADKIHPEIFIVFLKSGEAVGVI